jgi:hypothetical protein
VSPVPQYDHTFPGRRRAAGPEYLGEVRRAGPLWRWNVSSGGGGEFRPFGGWSRTRDGARRKADKAIAARIRRRRSYEARAAEAVHWSVDG